MVLSDRSIRAEIEAGRVVVEPYDPDLIQPSSIDVRVDRRFRVFHNARYPYIDVRQPMEDLTELVEVPDGQPFILHPGEFGPGRPWEPASLRKATGAAPGGRSPFADLGSLITPPAGFFDAGFSG